MKINKNVWELLLDEISLTFIIFSLLSIDFSSQISSNHDFTYQSEATDQRQDKNNEIENY